MLDQATVLCALLDVFVTLTETTNWLTPRLPPTLNPLHYDLWIHPEFYGSSRVFRGKVDIDMEVVEDTRTIIVHYEALNITSTTLSDQLGTKIPVRFYKCGFLV